jgi:hypothetical protein
LVKLLLAYYSADEETRKQWDKPIRNYHGVRNEVHDKASGLKQPYKTVVNGANLSDMIEARAKAMNFGGKDEN